MEELQNTEAGQRTFTYSTFGGYRGAFCGYAGYAHAIIPAVDDEFAKNLERTYLRIREFEGRRLIERIRDGKTQVVETNGIRVLFYPPKFEFARYHIGLRYNEEWVSEAMKFGHKKRRLRLCCLIDDPVAVERSWRDANDVSALEVTLPEVELKPVPATKAPVVVRGPVKAIVIGSLSPKDLFRYDDYDSLTVYVVDSDGIIEFVNDEGRWESRQ